MVQPPSTPLAAEVLERLVAAYRAAADPTRAAGMRAYMRDQFDFLGLPAPVQRRLSRTALAGLPRPSEADLSSVALGCWNLAEREYQYFACGYLRRHVAVCAAGFLGTARQLITERSWWDTVDTLAAHIVGPLVLRTPPLVSEMDSWLVDADRWLIRTALLHQLNYRDATDEARLFRYCLAQAGHRDFFVRKAIGWALRQYARTAPDAVREFVRTNEGRLPALAVREARRHL